MDGDVGELLHDQVTFALESVDRLYLNGYVPNLQVGGQVVSFLCGHRGNPVPSPALLERMTKDFVRRVEAFADANAVPILPVDRSQRQEQTAGPYLRRLARAGGEGVAVILAAQEKTTSFRGYRLPEAGPVRFGFRKISVFVKVYYFYLLDRSFGPAFIKVSTYFPFAVRVCVNGHEWLKAQLDAAGIAYQPLDNGLAACADPRRAQALARRLSPGKIEAFFARWVARLPWPFTRADRAAGFRHELSVLQFEYALTAVFDPPRAARRLIEALVRDHLDLGRPEQAAILFGRRHTARAPRSRPTRLADRDGVVSLSIPYKRSCRVKEYLKQGRALRIETVINDPVEVGVRKRLAHLPELIAVARSVNLRMLHAQRVSQQCIPETALFERVCLPSTVEGLPAPALRFGDRLVLGLLGALALFCHVPDGLTNASLRKAVQDRTGIARSSTQTSYDLRRLRLNGLIERLEGTHRYQVTTQGRVIAALYTRIFERVIGVAEHAMTTTHDCPHPVKQAWRRLDREVDRLAQQAGLRKAA